MATTINIGGLLYGGAIDGTVDINTNPFTLVDPVHAGQNLINANVLQRDAAFDTLTIEAACQLSTNGYIVFCKNLLTNLGTIDNSGGNATATVVGASAGQGTTTGGSTAGVLGVTGTTASVRGTYGYGGRGGNGGGGTPASPQQLIAGPGPSDPIYLLANQYVSTTSSGGALGTNSIGGFWAGGGGGGGAGDGTNKGGPGGGGGGIIAIIARRIDNSAGTIQANGGAGGTPTVGNTYGGGGGGGGVILLAYDQLGLQQGTLTCTGGAAGSGHGTGTAGNTGSDGYAYLVCGNAGYIQDASV